MTAVTYTPQRARLLLALVATPRRSAQQTSGDRHITNTLAGYGLVVVKTGIATITPAGRELLADWVGSLLAAA